jgi:hypothetical protein
MDDLTFPCDYPIILEAIRSDGVDYTHTFSGIEWWYHGNDGRVYKLTASSVQRANKIALSTWRRFIDWLIKVRA